MMAKYESEFMALREQTSVECEQFKTQLASKLRDEMAREKQELEKQMLQTRDAKIELVIEKLQEESRQMVERAERKAQKKFSQERAEYERKLKQTGEIEGVWMDKNRELHDKLSKLERLHDELRRENEVLVKTCVRLATKRATWHVVCTRSDGSTKTRWRSWRNAAALSTRTASTPSSSRASRSLRCVRSRPPWRATSSSRFRSCATSTTPRCQTCTSASRQP